ncbi:NAD-dependent epimerase/dehydratase family protein [Catenulispora pinisilvae]|uniref:NAD-dependent epimerase/dehydratase family protein n=1 Tax=Catenulispora pinisilvae TaxID=2705253 RepID=UPI00189125B8|nr:NAD(P)-dependent oxidoreductase [Catenulispora pinisilvae]
MRERILITGAAGRIGSALRPLMTGPDRVLRLLDINPVDPGEDGAEIVTASFADPGAIKEACDGVDAVVHLGGQPGEGPWEHLAEVNVEGTRQVLEAAVRQGVPRIVLASSIHAAGFWTRDDVGPDGFLPADVPPRPDTFYGVSKAAVEALGSLYHSRFGIDVSCLRLGAYRAAPHSVVDLTVWISHEDGARLVEACLAVPPPAGFRVLWGVSANARRWFSLAEGEAIGYRPRDDAERFAAGIPGIRDFDWSAAALHRVGGGFCAMPLG